MLQNSNSDTWVYSSPYLCSFEGFALLIFFGGTPNIFPQGNLGDLTSMW